MLVSAHYSAVVAGAIGSSRHYLGSALVCRTWPCVCFHHVVVYVCDVPNNVHQPCPFFTALTRESAGLQPLANDVEPPLL